MQKIKEFFKNHQDKFILTIGAILIAGASFAAGRISINQQNTPIEIKNDIQQETKIEEPININTKNTGTTKQENLNTENKKTTKQENTNTANTKNTTPQKPAKKGSTTTPANEKTKKETSTDDCQYVASSRGHKYYLVGSSSAKSLSEQNLICFPDEQAAIDAGYEPSASLK